MKEVRWLRNIILHWMLETALLPQAAQLVHLVACLATMRAGVSFHVILDGIDAVAGKSCP
jgi:hypothetical protein